MSDKINKDKILLNEQSNNPDLVEELDNIIDAKALAEIEAIQSTIEESDTPITDLAKVPQSCRSYRGKE